LPRQGVVNSLSTNPQPVGEGYVRETKKEKS